jgi:hypothetical protein
MSANGLRTSMRETTTPTVLSPIPLDPLRALRAEAAADVADAAPEEDLAEDPDLADPVIPLLRLPLVQTDVEADPAVDAAEDLADQEVPAANFRSCAVAPGIRWPALCAFPHGITTTDPR